MITCMLSKILSKLYPNFILLLIVILGFGLRFYKITEAPKGALIDELHFGYLAHSIIETGKDEHGVSYPIIFKGFGDQKLPAYAYFSIPSVYVLGLEVLAFRIPSLVAGTLIIIGIYLILLELNQGKKWALLGAFLTAVSPWPFFLSRIGFESNLALFFFVFSIFTFIRGVKKNHTIYFVMTGILTALTWYSYISYRPVTVAIFGVTTAYLFYKNKDIRKNILIYWFAVVISILPLFSPQAVGANNARLKQVGIFSDPGISMEIDENRTFCDMQTDRLICDSVFNKPFLISRMVLDRYLKTFSADWLATEGEEDIIFLTVKNYGQVFSVVYPFIIFGIFYVLINKKLEYYQKLFIFSGLIFAPVPTLLVGEAQKIRISVLLPFIIILAVMGLKFIYKQIEFIDLKYKPLQFLFLPLFVLAVTLQGYFYFVDYFTVHVVKNEAHYQSYLPELYKFLQTLDSSTQVVIKPFYSDPLMFYAFYTKMDPREYQAKAKLGELEASGFQHTVELGNIWAYDYDIETVGCIGHKKYKQSVFVTSQRIEGASMIYEGKATNGVHSYVFVYDATKSVDAKKCK